MVEGRESGDQVTRVEDNRESGYQEKLETPLVNLISWYPEDHHLMT
jgi:hypothetical protein